MSRKTACKAHASGERADALLWDVTLPPLSPKFLGETRNFKMSLSLFLFFVTLVEK
jgi:hypothetical protein